MLVKGGPGIELSASIHPARQVVFLCWMQDSNPGSLESNLQQTVWTCYMFLDVSLMSLTTSFMTTSRMGQCLLVFTKCFSIRVSLLYSVGNKTDYYYMFMFMYIYIYVYIYIYTIKWDFFYLGSINIWQTFWQADRIPADKPTEL